MKKNILFSLMLTLLLASCQTTQTAPPDTGSSSGGQQSPKQETIDKAAVVGIDMGAGTASSIEGSTVDNTEVVATNVASTAADGLITLVLTPK